MVESTVGKGADAGARQQGPLPSPVRNHEEGPLIGSRAPVACGAPRAVVQNGNLLQSVDFSGVKDCPGIRRSVRFAIGDGKATIKLSAAPSDDIVVAVAPTPGS
jgi:hypothetical protein